jgi:hypothetical protein
MTGATIAPDYLDDRARAGIVRGALCWRGLSPQAAADLLGVHRSTVVRWCQAASVAQLRRVAAVVGVAFVRVGE